MVRRFETLSMQLLSTGSAEEPQFGMASGYEGLGEYVFFRQIVSIEE